MFLPIMYTALTTICAFLSLIFSGIKPVIDFGWMMTLGLITSLLTTFTLLPAMLSVLSDTNVFNLKSNKDSKNNSVGSSGNPIGGLPELNDWTDSGDTLDGSVVYNLTGTDTYAVKAESGNAMVEITFAPETLTDATATETASVSTTTASSEVHPVYVAGDKYFAFDGTDLAEVTKDSEGQYTLLEGTDDSSPSNDSDTNGDDRSDALARTWTLVEEDVEQNQTDFNPWTIFNCQFCNWPV